MAMKPGEVLFYKIENIDIMEAGGRISAQAAGAYPPGVCAVAPGEYIDQNVMEELSRCQYGSIAVIKEEMK
jgi:arginine/lysine/ornithine decarboxylase